MKYLASFFLLIAMGLSVSAQVKDKVKDTIKTHVLTKKIVEISCGECMFAMKGDDCDLAIRLNGKSYFVDGKGIDDFGDAHAKDGFCNAIREAEVTGKLVNGRFKPETIKLLPVKTKMGKIHGK